MRIPGKRVRRTRLVRTEEYVIAVDVEAVIPDDDNSEACYESETVNLLHDIAEHAKLGDEKWLQQHGRVYKAVA
jgi:hypothetical protein